MHIILFFHVIHTCNITNEIANHEGDFSGLTSMSYLEISSVLGLLSCVEELCSPECCSSLHINVHIDHKLTYITILHL